MVITTEIMFVSSPSYYGRLRDRAILLFYLLSHDLNLAKVVFWGLVSVLRKAISALYTTIQKFGVGKIFLYFWKKFCSPSLHLFDKYSKNYNILKYHYNLK